jgi:hypothetical protein
VNLPTELRRFGITTPTAAIAVMAVLVFFGISVAVLLAVLVDLIVPGSG